MSGAISGIRTWTLRVALAVTALGCIAPARAGPGLTLEGGSADYRSTERLVDGTVANTESGRLDGGRLHLWWREPSWRAGLSLGQQAGTVRYQGRAQIGFPVRTRTDIGIDEVALTGQWVARDATASSITLDAALGLRRIDRSIAASLRSTPLTEVLRWRFAQIGAQAHWRLGDDWFAGTRIAVERGIGARLAIDFHGFADPAALTPGNGDGHTIGIELGRTIGPGTTLRLQASSSRQKYGASGWRDYTRGGLVAGHVHYPGSVQRVGSVRLLFEKNWN